MSAPTADDLLRAAQKVAVRKQMLLIECEHERRAWCARTAAQDAVSTAQEELAALLAQVQP